MAVLSEPNNLGDLLKFEEDNYFSRDQVTVGSGADLLIGTVVGKQTVNGKHYILAPAAVDGTETAVGVLVGNADAATADVTTALIVSRHCTVSDKALVWPVGITNNQKLTATAQLKALGVLIRVGV
ncbi:MAG: head decoration protein [Magnetococcales bacterium]|nr:head decoration protein [Magnetococcales bacterium]